MSVPQTSRSPWLGPWKRAALAGVVLALALLGAFLLGRERARADLASGPNALIARPAAGRAFVSFADVVDRVKPTVVSIRAEGIDDSAGDPPGVGPPGRSPRASPFGDDGAHDEESEAQGSGFIIAPDGWVVTNGHVVAGARRLLVRVDGGKEFEARLIGFDARTDVALLKIAAAGLPSVRLNPAPPRVGDWVVAVGAPFGFDGSVTAGIVSGRGRDLGASPDDDFLQIDAPINKGNSGGPAFDLNGDVIGMNTAIVSNSGGSIGLGFAVPAATVERVVRDLRAHGRVERGWMGVSLQPLPGSAAEALGLSDGAGAVVDAVDESGPAAAVLAQGDIVVGIEGAPTDARNLAHVIGLHAPGQTVRLDIVRGGRRKAVQVRLGEAPERRS